MREIDIENKITRNLKISLNHQEDYEQTYSNSPRKDLMTRFYFDVSYEQELWVGPETGTQVVHKRVIEKALVERLSPEAFNEVYYKECDAGFQYVQKRIPQAVRRLGCTCCYGSGPDLMACYGISPNGDSEIVYEVDFDFEAPDDSY